MRPEEIHNEKNANFATDLAATSASVELTRGSGSEGVAASLIGRVLGGHYEVMEQLGCGGMSAVYLCRHRGLNRLVALKVLHLDQSASKINRRRFELEAKATFQLNHPNLIRLLDFSVDEDELPYLVMEYVSGKTLADVIVADGRFDLERLVNVFTQICDGLYYAHTEGIIHRDLKPSNIMLTKRADGSEQAKIVDFGIAKIVQQEKDQQLTRTGDIFGSPLYMSPEQCKGVSPDQRSDLYSLGCAMFECLNGEPPFRAENAMQTMFMHVEKAVPPLNLGKAIYGNSAQAVEEVVLKLLAKDPTQRFQNAMAVKESLIACLNPGRASALQMAKRASSKLKSPVVVAIAVSALLMVVIGSMFYFHSASQASQASQFSSHRPSSVKVITAADRQEQQDKKDRQVDALAEMQVHSNQADRYRNLRQFAKAADEDKTALGVAEGAIPHDGVQMRGLLIGYGVDLFFADSWKNAAKVDETFSRVEPLLSLKPTYALFHQMNVYGWHGIACFNVKKYQQAYELSTKAQSISDKLPDQESFSISWMVWRGRSLTKLNQFDAALALYKKAEQRAGSKYPVQLADAYEAQANDLFNAGRVSEAQLFVSKAAKIIKSAHIDPTSNEAIANQAQKSNIGMPDR